MNKSDLLQEFDEVASQLLALLSSLDEEQLNRLPFPGSWTAGQVGDHLYKSYEIAHILQGNVEECNRPPDQKLAALKTIFADFSIMMDAPESVLPTTQAIQKSPLLAALKERLDQQRELLLTTDLSKICCDFAIPGRGYFTRLEWLGFNIIHTRRHLHQLEHIISIVNDNQTINSI